MNSSHRRLAAVFVLSFIIIPSAFAQTQDNNPVKDALETPFRATEGLVSAVFSPLENILLGGKRLPSPLKDLVSSSTSSTGVVTKEDIELSGARNIPEAMQEVPGVVISDLVGNGEEPTLDFRGYNEGQDFVFLIDGVKINEPKSNNINFPLIPIHFVEQIEVTRGGSSFLYGEGAMGGVANIVTKSPSKEGIHAKLESLVGSFGEWGESFEATAKDGNRSLLLLGDIYHIQGFRQNTSVEKEDFYAKSVWDVTDTNHLSLSYLYASAHLDRAGSIRESLLTTLGREASEKPRFFGDLETNLINAKYRVTLAESVVWSSDLFAKETKENSVAGFVTFVAPDNELDLSTNSWGFSTQIDHLKEIPWSLTEGLLIGMDFTDSALDEEDFNRSRATWQRQAQVVDAESNKEAYGIFSKASLSWDEKIGVFFGARYDNISYENSDSLNPASSATSDISKTSYSVGASYKASEPLLLSANYSKSFRGPSLSDLYANPAFGGNPALKPEEASNYEAGAKWESGKFLATSTLFMSHLTNEIGFQITDPLTFTGLNTNFGKTERYGIENAVELSLCEAVRLRGSYTYMEALFQSNDSFTEKSGNDIPMVPRNRLTAGLLIKPLKNWDVNLNGLFVSKQVLTNDVTNHFNDRRLPEYTVFNFKTIYRWTNWKFSFEVRNLFGEEYEVGGTIGPIAGDNFYVPAPGRAYSGTASYSW